MSANIGSAKQEAYYAHIHTCHAKSANRKHIMDMLYMLHTYIRNILRTSHTAYTWQLVEH